MNASIRSWRGWVGALALASGILGGTLTATGVHAAYTICRTDPIVLLSNGYQLNITDSISDTSADIAGVSYAVHVPKGLGINKITYTGGAYASKESLTVYADQGTGAYSVSTLVTTGTKGITASMSVVLMTSSTNKTLTSASASGHSGSAISVKFSHS